ncbi:peptidylprolyl isomerase [Aquimarina sp. U1-2]|uniref:peptidylprolyl isomerase n=1 Tax=Aquimarina sp. U1-2 TaxID=2823141 RepID=UPI001AECF1B5|nr:peptidylprolyl isomerase [Aquimarina sp. U1-2]MBP2833431.1 peptidylprolyl isomerase [Aquimarina sp. U1-2]
MSSIRFVFFFFAILMLFCNCEDTHSKKNKKSATPETTNFSKGDTSITKNILKPDAVKNLNTETNTSTKAPFKLTNDNLRAFMQEYGEKNPETLVRITTKFGNIDIQLYKETPIHRANFIYLVKQRYFDETFFYRVAKGFVIQGGNSDRQQMANKRFELGDYTIPQEPVKNLQHVRGAVALSKQWVDNPANRSTPYEFFIVVAKNGAKHLDGEHTIFGKVVKGMPVVDQISNVPVDGSEWPLENIFIKADVVQ